MQIIAHTLKNNWNKSWNFKSKFKFGAKATYEISEVRLYFVNFFSEPQLNFEPAQIAKDFFLKNHIQISNL